MFPYVRVIYIFMWDIRSSFSNMGSRSNVGVVVNNKQLIFLILIQARKEITYKKNKAIKISEPVRIHSNLVMSKP